MPPKVVNSRRRKSQIEVETPTKRARGPSHQSPNRFPWPRNTKTGVVLTCGQGDVGQLGLGPDVIEKKRFALIPSLENVVDIKAGGMHTVCLTSDGSVYTFGCDDDGALGRMASDEESFTPGKVELEGPAVQISAGDSHTAALLEDGRVFVWGSFRDSHGPMGLTASNEPSKTPKLIKLDKAVEKVASGSDHLVLMTVTGQLFSCGCPEQGQLGRVTARSASRDSRRGVVEFLTPRLIVFRRNLCFVDIWAASYGTYAKEKSNDIYRCGLNNYHQLGLNTEGPIFKPELNGTLKSEDTQLVKLDGGEHHTLLLDNKGKVFCLGRKEYGRLGLGKSSNDAHVATPIPALEKENCVDIACGSAVSFAVSSKGDAWGWGMGSNGQLSTGDDEDDVWDPIKLSSKSLKDRKVILAAAGGQHTVLLATK